MATTSETDYRARVRMYRHGLGDCFLLTFKRAGKPFNMLIDCGALARKREVMAELVENIRDTLRSGPAEKARLDVVVATHEHKDHVSGFNQGRKVFNDDFEFGAVWMGWTENLSKAEALKLKSAKKKAITKLTAALSSPRLSADKDTSKQIECLLGFSQDEDDTGSGKVADAMEYLKLRGKRAGDLRFLEPGTTFDLPGVDDVRVYVLGPPVDPTLIKTSAVTKSMKQQDVVYNLAAAGDAGMDALAAALSDTNGPDGDLCHPFGSEHRITAKVKDPISGRTKPSPYYANIKPFVDATYKDPAQAWRTIDNDWLAGVGELALQLDNDTNNTSLVLAFEFKETGEVLLFVADAQLGSWLSWANLEFEVPGKRRPVKVQDLLSRTAFYKVGHHCSHNATMKIGGLESMTRDDLVAFIPLDRATAKSQGVKGWDMPAGPLFDALKTRAANRVVVSDQSDPVPPEALQSGVQATKTHVDFYLT